MLNRETIQDNLRLPFPDKKGLKPFDDTLKHNIRLKMEGLTFLSLLKKNFNFF